MSFFNDYIQKIAADIDADKDKEIIKRIQKNPHDALAWRQLRARFKGVVQTSIARAGVVAPNVPKEVMEAAAMDKFEDLVYKYDESTGNKPSTYFIKNLTLYLKKLDEEHMFDTRMSPELTYKSKPVYNATAYARAELGREPTIDEIHDVLVKKFNQTNISKANIKRIKDLTRNELSANISMGAEDEGENINFGDIINTGKIDFDEYRKAKKEEERINKALNALDPQERKLFKEYEGLGEFKNKKAPSYAALAFNNNLNGGWQAQKIIKDINEKLRKELMKYDD